MGTWNDESSSFSSTDQVLENTTGYLVELLTEIGELRLQEQGLITVPIYWQLGSTGYTRTGGMPGTPTQLAAFVDELTAGAVWNLHVRDGGGLGLATHAILRGGHVAIGLGDDSYRRLGYPTNAYLIERLAHVADTIDRPNASPIETRRLLGL